MFIAFFSEPSKILAKSPNTDVSQMTTYCSDLVFELSFGTQSQRAIEVFFEINHSNRKSTFVFARCSYAIMRD